ncbi:MAG: cation transporter [Acidobacteria bacterium]|nr:cation transporter [Acidobacteriota bacterium]
MVAFVLVVVFTAVEVLAGWWTGSLALISDAGHMATDALGLGMALAAIIAADRARDSGGRTYGLYRAEILAALANAVLLFAVAGYVLFEAAKRIGEPLEIVAGPMLGVAIIGLGVNIIAWQLLSHGASESLNVEGAYLEVIADLIGSIGVIAAAAIIWVTEWTIVDPIIGAAIGLFILPRAWRLARKALRILLQAAPNHLDLHQLEARLTDISGVNDVHDLHVWTLTSDMDVGTVHLMTEDSIDPHPVLDQARAILEEHGISHATLQVEPESHRGCAEISW